MNSLRKFHVEKLIVLLCNYYRFCIKGGDFLYFLSLTIVNSNGTFEQLDPGVNVVLYILQLRDIGIVFFNLPQ